MFAKTKTLLFALMCATALIATACSGGSSAVAEGDSSDTSQSPGADDARSSESPIGDLLGIPIGNDDDAEQYFSDLSRQAEVKIAECMLAQGFEYQVVDYSQIGGLGVSVDFESREYAEQYGFGIASNPFEESFEAFESFEDPNQKYVESLTDGERDAYQRALSGELPDFSSDDVQSFEPSGCQGEAFESVFAFGRVFDQFGDAFEELEAAYEADPRIVNAGSGWSSCMADAGYTYAEVDDAQSEIRGRYDEIAGTSEAFAGAESGSVSISGDGEEEVFFGPQSFSPEAQALIDGLADEERAIATASWDCNAPVRDIEEEVRLEMEQRFVDENGAAIEALLDE